MFLTLPFLSLNLDLAYGSVQHCSSLHIDLDLSGRVLFQQSFDNHHFLDRGRIFDLGLPSRVSPFGILPRRVRSFLRPISRAWEDDEASKAKPRGYSCF